MKNYFKLGRFVKGFLHSNKECFDCVEFELTDSNKIVIRCIFVDGKFQYTSIKRSDIMEGVCYYVCPYWVAIYFDLSTFNDII